MTDPTPNPEGPLLLERSRRPYFHRYLAEDETHHRLNGDSTGARERELWGFPFLKPSMHIEPSSRNGQNQGNHRTQKTLNNPKPSSGCGLQVRGIIAKQNNKGQAALSVDKRLQHDAEDILQSMGGISRGELGERLSFNRILTSSFVSLLVGMKELITRHDPLSPPLNPCTIERSNDSSKNFPQRQSLTSLDSFPEGF